MLGDGPGGCGELLEGDAQLLGVLVRVLFEFLAHPLAHVVELCPEFGNQVGFALLKVLLKSALPLLEPGAELGLNCPLGLLCGFASGAGNVLDLLGESLGFLGLPVSLDLDALAQVTDLECLFLLGVGGWARRVGTGHGHGAQVFLKPGEALFHGVKLPSDDDFADFFDLPGRGGCG